MQERTPRQSNQANHANHATVVNNRAAYAQAPSSQNRQVHPEPLGPRRKKPRGFCSGEADEDEDEYDENGNLKKKKGCCC